MNRLKRLFYLTNSLLVVYSNAYASATIPHTTEVHSSCKEENSLPNRLLEKATLSEKIQVLHQLPAVQVFFADRPYLSAWVQDRPLLEQYLIQSLAAIDQAARCFSFPDQEVTQYEKSIIQMLSELKEVETFYDEIGGLIGYHFLSMNLLSARNRPQSLDGKERYFSPFGIDLTQDDLYLRKNIIEGIASQKIMAELCPLGGAADRLNLQDEKTHVELPAAKLEFLGHTLLDWLIRDVQAREYLYFKLFHEQVTTPLALMTSYEKNNHELIQEMVRAKNFFGRPQELFCFFSQPLVPTFTQEGHWCLQGPVKLLLKPGGHGAIWKLAAEKKVLEWFATHQRHKALVRQINNPIAGVDLGLIALAGIGCSENKAFGFASCARKVQASEGMNVLKQIGSSEGFHIGLSNIEYCDFKKFGIQDVPKNTHEPYSIFPSNTNVLFVDLPTVAHVVKTLPYPAPLVNFKKIACFDPQQGIVTQEVARLELLMQNIVDGLGEVVTKSLEEEPYPQIKTFITFNKRHKTISPTKKQLILGAGLIETVFGCFYDYLKNAQELLEQFCAFKVPHLVQETQFLEQGPSFIFLYHPALGPLYSIIGQKIRKGSLAFGSELQLEIADVNIEGLDVQGSFLIQADQIMGHKEEEIIRYSHQTGRCYLKNVTVKNQGLDPSKNNGYWNNTIARKEACTIHLEGWSEFVAQDVVLQGDLTITVGDGERVIARQVGDRVVLTSERMDPKTSTCWEYSVTPEYYIQLQSKQAS
jgi:UTP---glucose-1-phosphate uridylyltransferase